MIMTNGNHVCSAALKNYLYCMRSDYDDRSVVFANPDIRIYPLILWQPKIRISWSENPAVSAVCKNCVNCACGSTLNYSEIDSPGSKDWMVSQTRLKECLLTSFSIYVMYDVIHVTQSRRHVVMWQLCVLVKEWCRKLCIILRDFNYFALQTGKLNGFS